jgi:hypothetical protein
MKRKSIIETGPEFTPITELVGKDIKRVIGTVFHTHIKKQKKD